MLYCGLLLCSKVTHIIDPHRCNTLRYFPSKRMDFRSSTGTGRLCVQYSHNNKSGRSTIVILMSQQIVAAYAIVVQLKQELAGLVGSTLEVRTGR